MTATAETYDLTIDGSAAGTPQAPAATTSAAAPRKTNSRLSVVTTERRYAPKPSGKPDPVAHLSAEDIEELGRELDALRQEVLGSRGASDAAYIRKVIKTQRWLEMGSRGVLLFSIFPPALLLGAAVLFGA
jgi:linoleoyl-CoA desaturase